MMRTGLDVHAIASGEIELDFSGSRHQCRLDSISPSGAAVNCLGFLRETRRGDRVVLHLGAGTGDIACKVTAIAAAKIRLQFVDR